MAKNEIAPRDQSFLTDGAPRWSQPRTEPLEVMIVGLSRTGTTSMLEAMNILGYGRSWNSRTMFQNHQTEFCASILETKYTGIGFRYGVEQLESLIGEYRCVSGEFVACMAEDFITLYPEAKVILTIREDEDKWLESLLNTLWHNYRTWSHWILRQLDPVFIEQRKILHLSWEKLFMGNPAQHGLRVYREHNALVKRCTQPTDRLLVYNVKEGWTPLCRFLGKEEPKVPFPRVNETMYHRRMSAWTKGQRLKAILTAICKQSVAVGLLGALLWKGMHIWKSGLLLSRWRARSSTTL